MTTPTASPVHATWLVARREVLSQVRTKSFIISTVILLVAVFATTVFGGIAVSRSANATPVAVVSETEAVLAGAPMIDLHVAPDDATAVQWVEDGAVDAAVIPVTNSDAPLRYKLVALDEVPAIVTMATSISPEVELLDQGSSDEEWGLNYIVSLVFGIIFMMAVMTFGSTIAQNTVVEKQTRTVELLVSAVSSRVLLAGKILGISLLAIGQTAAVVLAGVLGLVITGQGSLLSMLTAPMLWFVVFFIFGFVLFAAIFAASASLVSRIEDTGSVLSPVIMLVMAPYFIVILFGTNPTVMAVSSYVPFTSIVAMPVRMFMGGVAWWEPVLSLLILALSDALVIAIAARIYRSSVLRTGPRLKLKEAWAGDRN